MNLIRSEMNDSVRKNSACVCVCEMHRLWQKKPER